MKSLKNNVKNSILDDEKLNRFFFYYSKFNSKLVPAISGIKLGYIIVKVVFFTFSSSVRDTFNHLGNL